MIENRLFHRVRFAAKAILTHDNAASEGDLENISLNGAMLSFNNPPLLLPEDECSLAITLDDDLPPMQFAVEIVHCGHTMIGLKFIAMEAETRERLCKLMERVTSEPEKLKGELSRFTPAKP